MRKCSQHVYVCVCMCMCACACVCACVYVCVYTYTFVMYMSVCVPCVRARAINTEWWRIPTTLRTYFSRRTRERERKMRVEKRREPGHRESKHVCIYCLSYPAPTNGMRVEINKLFDKRIFHSVDSSDIKVFLFSQSEYMYIDSFGKQLFNVENR